MPAMLRPRGKATKIAQKILGRNLVSSRQVSSRQVSKKRKPLSGK